MANHLTRAAARTDPGLRCSVGPAELPAWLRLAHEPGIGPAGALALVAAAGPPDVLYQMPPAQLRRYVPADLARRMAGPAPAWLAAETERVLHWLDGHAQRYLLTVRDPRYPAALLPLPDPPLLLYVQGRIDWLQRPALAIVGARNASAAGLENARAFAAHLARQGWCVVSGLARGIDAAAHAGALDAGPDCGTVAVLGTGMDRVYPAAHAPLAARIAGQGALVSELPLGTLPLKHHFPRRNRVVAGLARGVLVVEAARQSGSLGTARLAADFGREVFALPGSIHSPLTRGCHALIREGAKLVETAADIAEELGVPDAPRGFMRQAGSGVPAAPRPAPPAPADAPLLRALGHDPAPLDALVARTGLEAGAVQAGLLELELAGRIERLADGRFQRVAAD
ncbi:DNA-processing protein DprA [Orrella sp. JC864]|uniref:DNA-processing protein DprA n=1 Tax=Orrella sp. JC864 TaxID=3120298 RepID=UPI00300A2712